MSQIQTAFGTLSEEETWTGPRVVAAHEGQPPDPRAPLPGVFAGRTLRPPPPGSGPQAGLTTADNLSKTAPPGWRPPLFFTGVALRLRCPPGRASASLRGTASRHPTGDAAGRAAWSQASSSQGPGAGAQRDARAAPARARSH